MYIKIQMEAKEEQKPTLHLTQESENSPVNFIMVHCPNTEVFMSSLHPAASLYEDVTDNLSIKECYRNLKEILRKRNITVQTVDKALCKNRAKLEELAFNSLKYVKIEADSSTKQTEETLKKLEYYLSDEYKKDVISKMMEKQLVDIVFTQPTYKMRLTDTNTFIETMEISFNPLSNLVFCRDQQITTRKGIVIGRMKSSQRAIETKIMEQAYTNLGANIVGKIPEGAYLEGGDFFVAKPDLCMCGVGLRTTLNGVNYLMENDLLGTERFAVVYDEDDLDQQRMHLDTYFNIVNKEWVVCLDFDETAKITNKKIQRKVFLYKKKEEGIEPADVDPGNENIKKSIGNYQLIKVYDNFYEYLAYEGYKVIKITCQEQIDYMINFLNIGNNTVLCVNPNLPQKIKETGANVIYVEFKPVLKMYGALHCATQVSRIDIEGKK